jgi:hypothetical protein
MHNDLFYKECLEHWYKHLKIKKVSHQPDQEIELLFAKWYFVESTAPLDNNLLVWKIPNDAPSKSACSHYIFNYPISLSFKSVGMRKIKLFKWPLVYYLYKCKEGMSVFKCFETLIHCSMQCQINEFSSRLHQILCWLQLAIHVMYEYRTYFWKWLKNRGTECHTYLSCRW